MRILIDHSGYALLNIGDVAMLQACFRRLQNLWPDAEIQVFTESPERLELYCPGTTAVAPTIVGRRGASVLPMSVQLAAEQILKTAMPFLARSASGSAGTGFNTGPSRLLDAIRRADLVVSSGGGFINDVFWWHGAGVLSVLAMAQRLGKPTAMFGQGVGPLTHPWLSRLVKQTMPRLMVIGLREGLESVPLLRAHRVEQERIQVTGDDALLLAAKVVRPQTGTAIGMNVRVAPYSGVDETVAGQVVAVTRQAASRRGVPALPLPVSRYEAHSDLQALQTGPGDTLAGFGFGDLQTPEELAERAARCRVIVTGSYHAAVFGLAAGVPAICITNSPYYDGKFEGLVAQFPGGCRILRPGPQFESELAEAIDQAWDSGEVHRDDIHLAALVQVANSDQLYRWFKSLAAELIDADENNGAQNCPSLLTVTDSSEPLPSAAPDTSRRRTNRHEASTGVLSASVVIAAWTEARWPATVEAVTSALCQTSPPLEVILVIDHNPELVRRAKAELPGVAVVENLGPKGASGARNAGVAASRGEIVVFLDDDAAAPPDWLGSLCRHFSEPDVVGVGGGLTPAWAGTRPCWFPREFDWVVGSSYTGLPEVAAPIRNVWTTNMAIRRSAFDAADGFRAGFGKTGQVSRPEDTDLSLRVRRAVPSGYWMYDPSAEVAHKVPADRSTPGFFLKRCWHEGRGKAALARLTGLNDSTSLERRYATRVLPGAFLRELRLAIVRRDIAHFQRSAAIVAGLLLTAAGLLTEIAVGKRHRSVVQQRHGGSSE